MLERLIPSTLRGRLMLTYAVMAIALTTLVGFLLLRSASDLIESNAVNLLQAQATALAASVAESSQVDPSGAQTAELLRQIEQESGISLLVCDPNGMVIAASRGDPASYPLQNVTGFSSSGDPVVTEGDDAWTTLTNIPNSDQLLVVETVGSTLPSESSDLRRTLLLVAGLAALLAAIASALVANRIAKPLEALRKQAVSVSTGNYDVSIDPQPPEETAQVARAFNRMTAQIRSLMKESANSQMRLETMFSNLTDGVLLVDPAMNVLDSNPAARDLLAVPEGVPDGAPIILYSRDHDLNSLMTSALLNNQNAQASIHLTASSRILDVTAVPATSASGGLGILILRDVTELRRLEALRREFVANVSHELKTPLTSIRALVETLEAGAIDDPAVATDFMQRIVGEVDRLTRLVDELLDLGRLESGRVHLDLQPVQPRELLVAAADRLLPQVERAGLALSIETPEGIATVAADTARIEQVLLNLIHNAIKFTPTGGSILLTSAQSGQMVEFCISDTGVGMTQPDLDRVFERFYKSDRARSSEGTGLGLAIAKHIVIAHGGEIWAESQPGKGSSFRFTLPVWC